MSLNGWHVLDKRLDTFRAEIENDLDSFTGKINSFSYNVQKNELKWSLTVVFRKLPVNEWLNETVNMVIQDPMTFDDMKVTEVNRIPNDTDSV